MSADSPTRTAEEGKVDMTYERKQVPELTFSDEIRLGLRKLCGHIAPCDCQAGAVIPPHEWEPDFSEGEPSPDSKICGLCGREHSTRAQEETQ